MVLLSMCIVIARHCSSFPSHISIFQWKKDIHLFTKQTLHTKGSTIFHHFIKICLRRQGGYNCVTALTFANNK